MVEFLRAKDLLKMSDPRVGLRALARGYRTGNSVNILHRASKNLPLLNAAEGLVELM